MENYIIRLEEEKDHKIVENLIRESFWNVYRPGCLEHYLIHCLRNDIDFVHDLNFVMELNGEIIGQIAYMKAYIEKENNDKLEVMTIGPICIDPKYKRKGYGKTLLDYSMSKAYEMGVGAILLEGNINFYNKSGFIYASSQGINYHGAPEGTDLSFFLCKELKKDYLKNIKGEYYTPKGYFIDENEAKKYDEQFFSTKKDI